MKKGLMWVGGRLNKAPISNEARNAITLPKDHHIVNLFVQWYHAKSGHSGTEHVLSLIREYLWIVCGRTVVR